MPKKKINQPALTFRKEFKTLCIQHDILEKDVIKKFGMNRTKFYTLLNAEAFSDKERKWIEEVINELIKIKTK